jgi:hypothetical protein
VIVSAVRMNNALVEPVVVSRNPPASEPRAAAPVEIRFIEAHTCAESRSG